MRTAGKTTGKGRRSSPSGSTTSARPLAGRSSKTRPSSSSDLMGQNDALNANSWENNRQGKKKQPFRLHNFGATFGGPIIKDKTFFFFRSHGPKRRVECEQLGKQPAREEEAALQAPQLRRDLWRADHQRQDLLLLPISWAKTTR